MWAQHPQTSGDHDGVCIWVRTSISFHPCHLQRVSLPGKRGNAVYSQLGKELASELPTLYCGIAHLWPIATYISVHCCRDYYYAVHVPYIKRGEHTPQSAYPPFNCRTSDNTNTLPHEAMQASNYTELWWETRMQSHVSACAHVDLIHHSCSREEQLMRSLTMNALVSHWLLTKTLLAEVSHKVFFFAACFVNMCSPNSTARNSFISCMYVRTLHFPQLTGRPTGTPTHWLATVIGLTE